LAVARRKLSEVPKGHTAPLYYIIEAVLEGAAENLRFIDDQLSFMKPTRLNYVMKEDGSYEWVAEKEEGGGYIWLAEKLESVKLLDEDDKNWFDRQIPCRIAYGIAKISPDLAALGAGAAKQAAKRGDNVLKQGDNIFCFTANTKYVTQLPDNTTPFNLAEITLPMQEETSQNYRYGYALLLATPAYFLAQNMMKTRARKESELKENTKLDLLFAKLFLRHIKYSTN